MLAQHNLVFGILKGCDGSILIETKKGSKNLAEREAEENKELREEGFESIIKAKALVESHCPFRVSCSDILAIAARDCIHLVLPTSTPYFQFILVHTGSKFSQPACTAI